MNRKTADIVGWVAFMKIYVLVWRGILWREAWSAPLNGMFTWTSTPLKEISKRSTKWLDQQGNCSWTWLSFFSAFVFQDIKSQKKSEFEMCKFYFFFLRRKKTIEIQQIKSEWMKYGQRDEVRVWPKSYVIAQPCMCKRECVCVFTRMHTPTHRYTQIENILPLHYTCALWLPWAMNNAATCNSSVQSPHLHISH